MVKQDYRFKTEKSVGRQSIKIDRKYLILTVMILAAVVLIGSREYVAEYIPGIGAHTYTVTGGTERTAHTMRDMVVTCNKNGITGISKNGKEKWFIEAQLDKPLVSVADNKMAAASLKAKTVYVTDSKGNFDTIMTEEGILNVKVTPSGNVVALMDKEMYHGGVAVYNKSGVNLFTWWSGHGNLTDAALSGDGKTLAVAVLANENNTLKSNIIYFDITGHKEQKTVAVCEGELVSALGWCGGRLVAVSDARTIILNASGEVKAEIDYEGYVLNKFDISEKGNLVFVTGTSSLDRKQTVSSYTTRGRLNGSFIFEGAVESVDTNASRILIESGHEVFLTNRKGTLKKKEICGTDVYKCGIFKHGNRVYIDEGNTAKLMFIRKSIKEPSGKTK